MDIALDKEKFEGVQQLAEISMQIAKGKALISEIKDSTQQELDKREEEWRERLSFLLAESHDLIREIGSNHEELVAYAREVTQFVEDIRAFHDGVMAFRTASDEHLAKANAHLDDTLAVIRAEREQNRKEKLRLDAMRDEDAVRQRMLRNDMRKVRDDEGRLARAWKELLAKSK